MCREEEVDKVSSTANTQIIINFIDQLIQSFRYIKYTQVHEPSAAKCDAW